MVDVFLGNVKRDNYCSSSEDESETNESGPPPPSASAAPSRPGGTYNTGPKGVIEDWRRFKQIETEHKEAQQQELISLANKLSLSCRTAKEDEDAKAEEDKDFLEELETDEFLREYMQRRMEEMRTTLIKKTYGEVTEVKTPEEFLSVVEGDGPVIVHIYEDGVAGCDAMNGCLRCLAKDHASTLFVRVRASVLGTSSAFRVSGVPTLQAYRKGQLVANFVRLTDDLGLDFYADELETFLSDHGLLAKSH